MNENFVKSLYESIVEENTELYKELYKNTSIDNASDVYWKRALRLYGDLTNEDKEVLMEIIKKTMIDTVSNVLGAIDGSSTLANCECEPKLFLDNEDTDGELQDAFLKIVEELSKE